MTWDGRDGTTGPDGMLEQIGTVSITITAAEFASASVTFPQAYASPPLVYTTLQSTSPNFLTNAGAVTTTGCTVTLAHKDVGASVSTGSVIAWRAIGPPA